MKKIKYLFIAILVSVNIIKTPLSGEKVKAENNNCPELRIVFARGSGGGRWDNEDYLSFKNALSKRLIETTIDYDFLDLNYPAVGVGLDSLDVALGAFFGGGEAYEFGDSVNAGVEELTRIVNNECKETKYVIGGYSQGAMVLSKALSNLNSNKIIYVSTFGDPKIYLPEGKGLFPPACRNKNLSSYREYVPDCRAYEGLLGSYRPYEPENFNGKLGTWCNTFDIFCSSFLSFSSHTSYIADDLYEKASVKIFEKISEAFPDKIKSAEKYDRAFVFNLTGADYQNFFELKQRVSGIIKDIEENTSFDARWALMTYTSLDNNDARLVKICDFDSCSTAEIVSKITTLQTIKNYSMLGSVHGEILLDTVYDAVQMLDWRVDADRRIYMVLDWKVDNRDVEEVMNIKLPEANLEKEQVDLSISLGTQSWTSLNKDAVARLGSITIPIEKMNKIQSKTLKKSMVKKQSELNPLEMSDEKPTIEVRDIEKSGNSVKIAFESSGERTIVILNDVILGLTDVSEIVIDDLDWTRENNIALIPLSETRRGDRIEIIMGGEQMEVKNNEEALTENERIEGGKIPKAPNTGKVDF